MDEFYCEFCGLVVTRRVGLNDGYIGQLCENCDVVFTKASHAPDDVRSVNASQYPIVERICLYQNRRAEFHSRYEHVASFLQKSLGRPLARVLEVGSNVGSFVEHLRSRGVQVESVEINALMRTYQVSIRGLTCFERCEDISSEGAYDAVVFMDVLEHIPDPAQFLVMLRRLLAKDGVIYLQFPNKNSLAASIAGARWAWWSAPDHLYHFSMQGASQLARRAGYEVVAGDTVSPLLDDLSQLPLLGRFMSMLFRFADRWNVNPLMRFRRGSMLRVVIRPVAGASRSPLPA